MEQRRASRRVVVLGSSTFGLSLIAQAVTPEFVDRYHAVIRLGEGLPESVELAQDLLIGCELCAVSMGG
eukprot:3697860-Pyramimonas_sp.AAC.1